MHTHTYQLPLGVEGQIFLLDRVDVDDLELSCGVAACE
jgi:hypothetical protein